MNALDTPRADAPLEALEIGVAGVTKSCRHRLGTKAGIHQTFEIESRGEITRTVHIPLFEAKRLLGHALTEREQDILDSGNPIDIDVQGFSMKINQMHHLRDNVLLYVCDSGRRSLYAASLLRSPGYAKALSVGAGFQAWKQQRPQPAQAKRRLASACATVSVQHPVGRPDRSVLALGPGGLGLVALPFHGHSQLAANAT